MATFAAAGGKRGAGMPLTLDAAARACLIAGLNLKAAHKQFEQALLTEALKTTWGNKTKAAFRLNIHRNSFDNRLHACQLPVNAKWWKNHIIELHLKGELDEEQHKTLLSRGANRALDIRASTDPDRDGNAHMDR